MQHNLRGFSELSASTMEGCCRKRKRTKEAADREESNTVGMQEVPLPLPGWIDLGSPHNTPLPAGWEQCLDLQTGKMYFVNAATQRRVLEDPRISPNEQGMIRKRESLGLDMGMRLPALSNTHPNASVPGLPSIPFKEIPNQCNDFYPPSNYDIPATNLSLFAASCNTNLAAAAINSTSNMAAIVCTYCHTFVMVSRQAPCCPNCKNVCNVDLSVSSAK